MKAETSVQPSRTISPKDRWPMVRAIAEAEIRRLSEGLAELDELHASGDLNAAQAFEITCARWEAGKTAIRRAYRSQPDRRFLPRAER
jgi:hypothetical protein